MNEKNGTKNRVTTKNTFHTHTHIYPHPSDGKFIPSGVGKKKAMDGKTLAR